MADDIDELTGGWRRALSTVRLSGKLGMKAAGRMLRRRAAAEPDAEAAIATARKLVDKMGHLKGLVMKAGQIASYMPGALPAAAREVLSELQAKSTPMAWARVVDVLRAELGDAPFEQIDERPLAAASIGQVHRAVYGGTAVAVKIQYPGIEAAIASDLKMAAVLARLSSIGSSVDGGSLAGELRDRLLEECDYRREAANQELFARLLADVPGASVPRVIAERSTQRVLTTELVDLPRLPELVADQPARDQAAQTIFRASFQLLWGHAVYNADPHPGNYLVSPDGAVTFLDFGCIRRFDPEMIRTWKRLVRALLDGDRKGFPEHFRALGFVAKEKGFDWDYQWNAMRFLYQPFLEDGFRYHDEFVAKTFGVLWFDNPNKFKTAMPPEWLFLNRLQWGLNAVMAQMHATGPWRALFEQRLDAPIDPA